MNRLVLTPILMILAMSATLSVATAKENALTGQSSFTATYQKLEKLKNENPKTYQRLLEANKQKLIAKLTSLKKDSPDKYRKIQESFEKARLQKIEKFSQDKLVQKQKTAQHHMDQLQKDDPEKYHRLLKEARLRREQRNQPFEFNPAKQVITPGQTTKPARLQKQFVEVPQFKEQKEKLFKAPETLSNNKLQKLKVDQSTNTDNLNMLYPQQISKIEALKQKVKEEEKLKEEIKKLPSEAAPEAFLQKHSERMDKENTNT